MVFVLTGASVVTNEDEVDDAEEEEDVEVDDDDDEEECDADGGGRGVIMAEVSWIGKRQYA